MGLFGKKKDAVTDSVVPAPPAPEVAAPAALPPAAPSPALTSTTDARIDVALSKELGEVERSIDLFVSRDSRPGLLDRYKEKYGEDLDLPSGLDSYRHTYLEPELTEAVATTDISASDFSFAKPAEGQAGAATADVNVASAAPSAAAPQKAPIAGSKPGVAAPKKLPPAKSLFARKSAKDKAAAAPPTDPAEPGWGFALPEYLTTFEKVSKGLPGLFLDWTCVPFYRYAKARQAYRNTLYLYILLDLALLLVPFLLPLLVKVLLGWVMPVYRAYSRRTGVAAQIAAEKKRRAQAESAAKAAAAAAATAAGNP